MNCKTEGIYWVVIQSYNDKISKSLQTKVFKITGSEFEQDTCIIDGKVESFGLPYLRFWETKRNIRSIDLIERLKEFKRLKFKIVRFTDKQFGMQGGHVIGSPNVKNVLFGTFTYGTNIVPITELQHKRIIKINF